MANIETWCIGESLTVALAAPDLERRVVVRVEGKTNSGALRMTCAEAIKLRDALSRAITEAATASAKAVEGEAA